MPLFHQKQADTQPNNNTEHLHSTLGFVTPPQRHEGSSAAIFEARNRTLKEAYQRHP